MKHRLRSALILAVSLVLLYFVLRQVGLRELSLTLRQADPFWLLLSLMLEPFLLLASVIRWQTLVKSQGHAVPLRRLSALYLIGRFYNNFLPSTVGGDVVRAYELKNDTQDLSTAMASVLVDRLMGLVVLLALALASLGLQQRIIGDFRLTSSLLLVTVALLVVLWLILDRRPLMAVERWIKAPGLQAYASKLRNMHASLNAYRRHGPALAQALLWSAVFMLLAMANVYTSARAFHQPPIPFVAIAVNVPIIMVVAMMPLTLNGLGIEEWAYVLLFSWIGLPASVGLSAVIVIRAKSLLLAALGGVIYPSLKLSKLAALRQAESRQTG